MPSKPTTGDSTLYSKTFGTAFRVACHQKANPRPANEAQYGATALYRALSAANREIRLIRVVPTNGNAIQCGLDVISLDDAPEYEALSYCWTSDQPSRTININDTSFAVRPNLYDYLQLRCSEQSTGWVFIDAICINQQDLVEKAGQVRLMGDVYRGATEVVAWLNEERDNGFECAPFLPQIQEVCDKADELIRSSDVESYFKALVAEEWDMVPLVALSFCNCAYWTRMWVVQELTLARKLTLRTAHLTIDWEVLFHLLEHRFPITTDAASPFYTSNYKSDHMHLSAVAAGLGTLGMILRSTEENKSIFETAYYRPMRTTAMLAYKKLFQEMARTGAVPIPTVIPVFASQQCSDLHDKVFGLLGMTRSGLPIDYFASISELYMQALIEILIDLKQISVVDAPLNVENILRVTAALVSALRDGQHFWTMALITTETLSRFDLPIADLFMGFFISEYKLLNYLDNLGSYGKRFRKFLDRSFGSSVVFGLRMFKEVDHHKPMIFQDGKNDRRYQDWVSRIDNAYKEALERHEKKAI